MTRAVFLSHTAAPSGAELATLRLLSALDAAGQVRVSMLLTEDGPLVRLLRQRGIPVTVCGNDFDSRSLTISGSGPLRLLGGALDLVRLGSRLGEYVRAERAEVVVAQSTKALLMGAVAARRARVPLVWQVHDRIAGEYFGTTLALSLRILGRIVARGVLANSRATLATLYTRGRVAAVAYPGVEGDVVEGDVVKGDATDQAAGRAPQRDPADTRIVLVGRLTPWKGHDVLLRALPLLSVPPRAVTFVGGTFFGEDAYRAELERSAAGAPVPVEFAGHVEDPGPSLRAADIAVHCSVTPEPFGQVVVEAMRAGCAVVAADAGGPTEIVRPEVDGLLVTPGDPAALAAALDRLIADPALRTRLGAAAVERSRDFGIEQTAHVVTGVLRAVTGRPAGAAR